MKRPTINDDSITITAAKILAPKVKTWLGNENRYFSLSEIEADLIKAIKWGTDGYEIARNLEDASYFPDAALVEILDETYFIKRNILNKLEEEWANNNEAIPLNTRVTWPHKPDAGIGIVTKNHPGGKSTVMFEKLGHVRDGVGCHGYIVEWEKLVVEKQPIE